MITKKKEAVEALSIYNKLIENIIGKPCVVSFDRHTAHGFIIESIEQVSLKNITHKPDKVEVEGKNKSPMLFQIKNNQCPFIFTFDDTIITGLGNGIRIIIPLDKPLNGKKEMEIDIRLEKE